MLILFLPYPIPVSVQKLAQQWRLVEINRKFEIVLASFHMIFEKGLLCVHIQMHKESDVIA